MTNGNPDTETRLSALETEMQEMRNLLRETQQIANSNAKAIQAGTQATNSLREAVRLNFDDILGLIGEIARQQQQNTQDIGNLRAIVQDWITEDSSDETP